MFYVKKAVRAFPTAFFSLIILKNYHQQWFLIICLNF